LIIFSAISKSCPVASIYLDQFDFLDSLKIFLDINFLLALKPVINCFQLFYIGQLNFLPFFDIFILFHTATVKEEELATTSHLFGKPPHPGDESDYGLGDESIEMKLDELPEPTGHIEHGHTTSLAEFWPDK